MRKSLALLICMGVVASSSNLEAITGFGRLKSMAGWGTAVGAVLYGWLGLLDDEKICPCPFEKNGEGEWTIKDDLKCRYYSGTGAGVTTALFVHWLTSYYTPSYRYEWAIKERDTLSKGVLFNHGVTRNNIKDMMVASGAESSPLQYVAMFLRLSDMDKKLSNLKNELEIALKDAGDGSVLGIQISHLIDQIDCDLIRIRESEHTVKNYDSVAWTKQWEIHTHTQLKEKQIAAMSQPNVNYHLAYHI